MNKDSPHQLARRIRPAEFLRTDARDAVARIRARAAALASAIRAICNTAGRRSRQLVALHRAAQRLAGALGRTAFALAVLLALCTDGVGIHDTQAAPFQGDQYRKYMQQLSEQCLPILTRGAALTRGYVRSQQEPYVFYKDRRDSTDWSEKQKEKLDIYRSDRLQPEQPLWVSDVATSDGKLVCAATAEDDGWIPVEQIRFPQQDEPIVPTPTPEELVGMWEDEYRGTIVIEADGRGGLMISEAYNCDGPCSHYNSIHETPGVFQGNGVWVFHHPETTPTCAFNVRRIGNVLYVDEIIEPGQYICTGGMNTTFRGRYWKSKTNKMDCGEFRVRPVELFACLHNMPPRGRR